MHQRQWEKIIFALLCLILLFAGVGILMVQWGMVQPSALFISTGLESVEVLLGNFFSGTGRLGQYTQNYLLFDRFVAGDIQLYPILNQWLGIFSWLLVLILATLLTLLKRNAFLLGAGLLVLLLTISGVNSLNIGGVGTNYGLVICLVTVLLPAALIHLFFENTSLGWRILIVMGAGLTGLGLLIYLARAPYPTVLFSENIFLMTMSMAAGFLIYTGQSMISGLYLILARLNQGVGIKIGWHFALLGTAYLALMGLMLLDITGSLNGWPLPPLELMLVLTGLVGYFDIHHKIRNSKQPYSFSWVGNLFYLTGFAICLLVVFKARLAFNTPMLDFVRHFFIYSQLGFGLLFFLYIWVNFSGIINSGTAIEKIVYKPPFFPYFHMRLGAVLSLLIFIVYADGIVAVQFSTSSTQLSADYYLAANRPVEATVLYENAFERYRRNQKALYASAQLYLDQNQPTLALNTLMRSFEENPQVRDIILLSELLEKRDRINEAIYYLEEGLKYYPSNAYLANNLGLIYHQMKRPDDALEVLGRMNGQTASQRLNRLGIKIMHGKGLEEGDEEAATLKEMVNLTAHANVMGKKTAIELPVDSISQVQDPVNRAMLRNHFTAMETGVAAGRFLEMVDTLLNDQNLLLSHEESVRESGLVLAYRAGRINELLRRLNGMAFRFKRNAGYYHAFAGYVFAREGDFKKAAASWNQAAFSGFARFTPAHLPYLYFGGMQDQALFVSGTQGVDFPEWMRFDDGQQLIGNDTVKFYQILADLPEMLGKELMPALNELESESHRAFLAKEMILKKGHWFEPEQLDALLDLASAQEFLVVDSDYLSAYVRQVKGLETTNGAQWSADPHNAYLTPMVLAAANDLADDEKRYALLQEASQFNKDPLLWIELVRYSRIIGMDQYASSNLAMMAEWIAPEDLLELQLENF
ncbi:Tetratricopeptide repeat-containing protein [Cyclobacterium lianum]|uniref:Tetratricopeptide repeat-containing protein n=1 Tax=Cyclobacterium lianum TaxID=388280 RepID=A0A1M7J0S5_9BACT|nr:tetratricopeptide repeat protein [Cyclobacterium lianum]SHM46047.1 Tetratricopeptide repeat-containing protein [Cyclobacterium lianum]